MLGLYAAGRVNSSFDCISASTDVGSLAPASLPLRMTSF